MAKEDQNEKEILCLEVIIVIPKDIRRNTTCRIQQEQVRQVDNIHQVQQV